MGRSRSRSPRSRSRSRSDSRRRVRDRSDSRSRSDSRGHDDGRKGSEKIKVGDDDAAFILGRGGKTKQKLARVSGAEIELHNDQSLEFYGTDLQRRKARKYVECVMAQRVGPVYIDDRDSDGDLTLLTVPHECVGFVTGSQGNFLRTMEDEWNTLMFFAESRGGGKGSGGEKLAIFGDQRGRRGAELKVMSSVEVKCPGHFTSGIEEHESRKKGFDTDTLKLREKELSWALGKSGSTRKKLARASEAIIEYVGLWVHIAGNMEERQRGHDYLDWTMAQLESPRISINTKRRDDVTVLKVPQDTVGYVTGARRATLLQMEQEWGVMMLFINGGGKGRSRDPDSYEELAIFGPRRGRRGAELKVMSSIENKNPGWGTRDVKDFKDDRDWGTDTFILRDDELSYALGSQGYTRKKLQASSGCIVQYVGNAAFFAGTYEERRRARRYMRWLLEQRHGAVRVKDADMHDDVQTMTVPAEAVGQLMGQKGHMLRKIEEETGTFLFMARDHSDRERLFVCGCEASGRQAAEKMIDQEVRDIMDGRAAYNDDEHHRDRRRDRSDSYDRAPRRIHERSRSRGRRSHSRGR
eukprot:TRINITY_DN725_c0_g1_i7.p1 TRINITY_DN725_c0_g1~~TRINITY_DN725_c0_g1_i7.p1  ORF type:complete len:581 (+),score=230.81 TRINITY_DN725_c0_g1_i7:111-1853(+)